MSEHLPVAPKPPDPERPAPMDRVSVVAFVLSLLGVGLVAIPLAVWGLVRTRPGPRRGRGFAIAALGVSAAWALASVVLLSYGLLGGTSGNAVAGGEAAPTASQSAVPSPTTSTTSPSTSVTSKAAVPAQSPKPTSKPRRVYWEDLRAGMCIRTPQNSSGTSVTVVDCRSAHDEEVTARTTLAGPKVWPGDVAMQTAAEARCRPAFGAYVGTSFDDSRLEMDFITTDPDGWKSGDHRLICLVLDPSQAHLTHALRGIRE